MKQHAVDGHTLEYDGVAGVKIDGEYPERDISTIGRGRSSSLIFTPVNDAARLLKSNEAVRQAYVNLIVSKGARL